MGRSSLANTVQTLLEWEDLFFPASGMKVDATHVLTVRREVIPIIFVPGIMGSILWRTIENGQGEEVWNPDRKAWMFVSYGLPNSNAETKRAALIGPDQFNADYLWVKGRNDVLLPSRGWEGVIARSYKSIRRFLESYSWPTLINCCFHLPVHAFGYNWSASNSVAGEKLAKFISDLCAHYRKNNGRCDRVILATHSMGGLVARACCKQQGFEDRVLGVVHGVQPANGAPAAYWRMKAGFERNGPGDAITAWVLGTNGEEVTALLGNMPGGLELLPNRSYKDNAGNVAWLRFLSHENKDVAAPRPSQGNALEEIYATREEYCRLVNPAWLNPGSANVERDWAYYSTRIGEAVAFQDSIADYHHPNTYYVYGHGGGRTADRVVFKCKLLTPAQVASEKIEGGVRTMRMARNAAAIVVALATENPERALRPALSLTQDVQQTDWWKSRGSYETIISPWQYYMRLPAPGSRFTLNSPEQLVELSLKMKIEPPCGSGDGTVPESSGKGLGQIENQGGAMATCLDDDGVGHEEAYRERKLQEYTANAIVEMLKKRIVQNTPMQG